MPKKGCLEKGSLFLWSQPPPKAFIQALT